MWHVTWYDRHHSRLSVILQSNPSDDNNIRYKELPICHGEGMEDRLVTPCHWRCPNLRRARCEKRANANKSESINLLWWTANIIGVHHSHRKIHDCFLVFSVWCVNRTINNHKVLIYCVTLTCMYLHVATHAIVDGPGLRMVHATFQALNPFTAIPVPTYYI